MPGITGLAGLGPVVISQPQASPEQKHGGPANPAHGTPFWANPPQFPWLYQPGVDTADASVPASLLGAVPATAGTGNDPSLYSAPTETGSHAAPWPSFGTEDLAVNDREVAARHLLANQDLRAADTGDAAARTSSWPDAANKMTWGPEADYVSAGETILQPVPGQLQGQAGRDRVQGTPALNADGFDSAHVYRPRGFGEVPGNFLWLDGRQRPMLIQRLGRQSYPVGPDSPFAGQTPGAGAVEGAVLSGLPPVYSAPPFPPSETAPAPASSAPVWGWGA